MSKLLLKRGPSSNLTSVVLDSGEPAFTTDTKKLYIGNDDGTKTLVNPDQAAAETAVKLVTPRNFTISGDGTAPAKAFDGTQAVDLVLTLKNSGITAGTYPKVTFNAKGIATASASLVASDIPSLTLAKITDAGTAASKNTGTAAGNIPILDASGKLDENTLPAIAITDVFEAASESAMLALTAQKGDVCVRSDISKNFILKQAPASTLANWVELKVPAGSVASVNTKTGVVVLNASDVGAEPTITAGTASQYLKGNKTWGTFLTDVLATVLTGLSTATSTAVVAADSILTAIGKLQAQINLRLVATNIKAGTNVTVSVSGNDVTINSAGAAPVDATTTVKGIALLGATGGAARFGTPADVNLGNVTNESKATMFTNAALTGTPTAPTATAGTNTTQISTTAFVTAAVASKANLASPTFTGTPLAPTAAVATNNTQIATTAFVKAQGYFDANSVIDGGTF